MKKKSFKIVQVIISLGNGGAERSCSLLSQMLENKGHEVHTVILNDEITYEYSGKLFNLGSYKSEQDSALKRVLRFKKLRAFLKENKFDVVIDHRPKNDFSREVFYDKLIYRGIPRIYVVHSSLQDNYFTPQPQKMVTIYNKNVANVAVSNFIKENMEKLGVKKCTPIHNTTGPIWHETTRNLPEKLNETPFLLWYGRIDDSVKDLSFLLESYQLSLIYEKGIQLVIMGGGKDSEKIKQKATGLPCRESVHFLGFNKNPFPIIAAARATILTSRHEGFPMVLVESLSVGTPVVSLDIKSGPSEIIDHKKNGLLVPERNSKFFAAALREMCFDKGLYQICKKNAKASVADFSMEIIGERWNRLLNETLA